MQGLRQEFYRRRQPQDRQVERESGLLPTSFHGESLNALSGGFIQSFGQDGSFVGKKYGRVNSWSKGRNWNQGNWNQSNNSIPASKPRYPRPSKELDRIYWRIIKWVADSSNIATKRGLTVKNNLRQVALWPWQESFSDVFYAYLA